jgi:hypothetical protein
VIDVTLKIAIEFLEHHPEELKQKDLLDLE